MTPHFKNYLKFEVHSNSMQEEYFFKLYSHSLKPPLWIKINFTSSLAHFSGAPANRFMNPGAPLTPTLGDTDVSHG